MSQKNFQRNLDTSSSFLSINFFATRNFLKHISRRVALRNVSVLKDKKFSTENRDISLRSINFFNTRKGSKTKGFPYEIFRHFDTINFRRKNSIFPPHPFLFINYFATRNFLKHSIEGCLYEVVRYCGAQMFRQKIVT